MYAVEILDPFLKQQFLQKGHPYTENNKSFTFTFENKEEFINLSISFIIRFSIKYTFTSLLQEGICREDEKKLITSSIPIIKIDLIVESIYSKLLKTLDSQDEHAQFDFIKFFLSQLIPERKKIKNLFYEAIHSLYSKQDTSEFLNPNSNIDFVYFVVLNTGSVRILDKQSNEIAFYYYNEQEEAVAKTCHLNPDTLLIYDHLHLLNPELVICFKQLFRKKVTFLETEFPNYQNRA